MAEEQTQEQEQQGQQEAKFTQADIDKIVQKRLGEQKASFDKQLADQKAEADEQEELRRMAAEWVKKGENK